MGKKLCQWMLVGMLAAGMLAAQQPAAAPEVPKEQGPVGAVEPDYRGAAKTAELRFNPFEPLSDVRSDANSEAAQAMLKRIKGYVVQANGSPLLVIDGKSYRIKDKVPLEAAAATAGEKKEGEPTPAAIGGQTATILNITQNEAVFQKDDPSGFGGETFKIFFNFKHETDEAGKPN